MVLIASRGCGGNPGVMASTGVASAACRWLTRWGEGVHFVGEGEPWRQELKQELRAVTVK